MVLLSDGSDDEAAAAAQAVAQQERRLARQQRAKARAQATCQLFEEFDQFTQKRWATVKLLAEHGFVEQSQRLAADVQILQDCCDANRALIGKFADQHADRRQHAPHAAGQDPQDRQPAGQGPAGPPAASLLQDAPSTDQHLHGSTPAPQQQPARAAPPPPPPPLPAGHSFLQPAKGRPALPGGARLVGRPAGQGVHATSAQGGPAKPPPPPPGPPPAHKWSSSSSTSAAGGAAAGGAGSSTRGPAAPPPPPPGPPPPHSFAGAHSKGPSGASSSKGLDQQQQRQGGSSPRPPPPPPPLPPVGLLPGSPCRTLTTTNSSSSGSSSPMPAGRSPGKAPPPPPPLPPGGFLGGGPSLRSPVSRPRTAPGACGASTNNSSPSGTPAAAGVAAGGSAAGGGTMGGLNPIAAAAAAAGARRALQDGAGPEPSTPKGALLRSHQHHHSFSGGVSSIGLASPLSADGLAGGAGGAGGSCGKLKRLHVDPVPQHRMTNGSFWRTTEDVVRPFQAEFEYALRSMFSNTPASGRRAAEGAGGGAAVDADDAAGRVIKVIADKRALQVEVCIKRLRMDASKLAAALNRIDTDKLKQDDLPQIRSMLPKPDELSAVAAAKKKALKEHAARVAAAAGGGGGAAAAAAVPPEPRLGVVEEAFEALGGVRMLMAKMRACEFKYDIEAVGVQVDEFVTDLSACLDAFRTCGQLQYLLAFVRDVANTMNASAVAGGAAVEGLKLESLNRLQSTRMVGATDLNLLHYIVAHLSKAMPWVLAGLEAEREAFKAAMKRGTFDTVLTRVRGLRDMHKRISTDLKKAEEHLRHTTSSPLHSSSNKAPGTAATSNTSASSSTPALAEGADPAAAATPAAVSDANPAAAGSLPAGSPPAAAAAAAAAASEASDAEQRVYIGRLSSLLRHAGCRLEGMTGQMERLMQQFRWTAEFFCEDVGARWKEQPAAFILHFADLLDAIEAAKKDTARIAKVNKVLTQFDEERQRQEEEAAEAAAAEAAAAAAAAAAGEDGCYLDDPQYHQQLCFRGEEEEQRQYGQGVAAGCDDGDREGEEEDGEQQQQQQLSRLTLTNSWVLGVARSLQFGSSRSDEEQEEQQGAGPAASTAAAAAEGRRVQRVGGSSGAQQLQGLQQQAAQASTSAAAAAEFAGDQPQQQVHPQQQQQQSDGLALPVTYWHNDMLAGTWGSSLSVVSGGDRLSTRTGSTSSSRSSTGGSNSLGGGVTAAAAAAAAAAADAPAAGQQ